MSILGNQTAINTTTDFFLSSSGGESTVPVFVPITTVSTTSIAPGATTILALVPIPDQYIVGDTLLYQVSLNFQSITTLGEGTVLAEISVAFANEDNESTGNQTYYPIYFSNGQSDFKLTLVLTDVRRASADRIAIRIRNTGAAETLEIATIQFIRSSFQFVSANSI